MPRSVWKLPNLPGYCYRLNFYDRLKKNRPSIKIYEGSLFLSNQFLNTDYKLYNGRRFITIPMYNTESVWKYLGGFNFTKRRGGVIHIKNKKNKKQKSKKRK